MAKKVLTSGKLTFGGTAYGVTAMNHSANTDEVDVTDTDSATGENEYLSSGRFERTVDFTVFKDHDAADLTIGGAGSAAELDYEGFTYAGTLILLSKQVTGQIKNAITMTYSGRFSGAVTETVGS